MEIKKLKKEFINTLINLSICIPFFFFLQLIFLPFALIFLCFGIRFSISSFLTLFFIYLYKNRKNKTKKYIRDIPKDYSVAMASFLFYGCFERTLDIPATILSLIGKKVIYCNDNKTTLQVNPNYDTSKLFKHEQYIYSQIEKNSPISVFRYRSFLTKDLIKKKLIQDNPSVNDFSLIINILHSIYVALFFVFMAICLFYNNIYNIIIFLVFSIIYTTIEAFFEAKREIQKNTMYVKTKQGENENLKLHSLKLFLEDFSSLDKKDIEASILWEDYLSYAYIFKINDKIDEEFNKIINLEYLFKISILGIEKDLLS